MDLSRLLLQGITLQPEDYNLLEQGTVSPSVLSAILNNPEKMALYKSLMSTPEGQYALTSTPYLRTIHPAIQSTLHSNILKAKKQNIANMLEGVTSDIVDRASQTRKQIKSLETFSKFPELKGIYGDVGALRELSKKGLDLESLPETTRKSLYENITKPSILKGRGLKASSEVAKDIGKSLDVEKKRYSLYDKVFNTLQSLKQGETMKLEDIKNIGDMDKESGLSSIFHVTGKGDTDSTKRLGKTLYKRVLDQEGGMEEYIKKKLDKLKDSMGGEPIVRLEDLSTKDRNEITQDRLNLSLKDKILSILNS